MFLDTDYGSPLPRGQVYTCESRCGNDKLSYLFVKTSLISKHNLKSVSLSKLVVSGILVLCILLPVVCAQALGSEDDISAQAEAAQQRLERFMRESIGPRLAYEYKDYFFDEKDAVELAGLARGASSELQEIYDAQEGLRKRIEDYEGDDWDLLYGATGLWRKVCADGTRTLLFKGQVDYFAALASRQQDRVRILGDIIYRCKITRDKWEPAGDLLMARALKLAGQNEAASKTLDPIYSSKGLSDAVYFRAEILKSQLSGINSIEMLEGLFRRVGKSRCGDDFELHLRLAFLALRLGEADLLKEVIAKWPEGEDFAGRVILSEMEYQRSRGQLTEEALLQKSPFEVTLAVKAAQRRRLEQYQELIEAICGKEKFQTPAVLYVTAQAYAESAPAAAVEYYRRSALAQQEQKSDELEIEAVEIAKQGAQLAHRVYYEEPGHCHIVRQMINYYCRIAGEKVDETIQYLYTRLLNDEGRSGEAIELLLKIAEGPGKYSKQARLDLIIGELKMDSDDGAERYKQITELEELIASASGPDEQDKLVRAEATDLCCQLLLEEGDKSAHKVMELLSAVEGMDIEKSAILKAGALLRLGQLPEAVRELLPAAESRGCEWAERGMEVLSAVLAGPIDQCAEEMADFAGYIHDCDRLARYCLACARGEWRPAAGLIGAEFTVLAAGDDKEKLGEAEEILIKLAGQGYDNDIAWLRCKGRLLKAKGEFAAAAVAWGRVRAVSKSALQVQSRQWWRAKFYEIQCWGKLGDTSETDVAHAVEVLESSFSDIPRFWAVKLEGLKDGADQ